MNFATAGDGVRWEPQLYERSRAALGETTATLLSAAPLRSPG